MSAFDELLAESVRGYVRLRRSAGYDFRSQAATLESFRLFVEQRGYAGPLTREIAMVFVLSQAVTPNVRARRHGVLRRFAEYLVVFDGRTELLDPRALARSRAIPPVRILDDDELARLLAACREVFEDEPLRGLALHAVVGLIASTGMRSGEARRLDRADVDLTSGVLTVRRSKFRKDRLVPMHPTTTEILRSYAAARDAAMPTPKSEAFFLTRRADRMDHGTLSHDFRSARARAGLDGGTPRPPRPHDLRHRFAVTRLVRWSREGVDVQARLPVLAAYMGHVNYSSTAYYVTATAELLALASERAFGETTGGA